MSTCIACRFRRKKCDKKKPICTSCYELGIPSDLCVTPSYRLGLRSKNSKVTLDELKSKRDKLRDEEKALKSLLSGKLPESSARMKLSNILNHEGKLEGKG